MRAHLHRQTPHRADKRHNLRIAARDGRCGSPLFGGNKALGAGGGIYNYRAALVIDPSTICGNSAAYGGGVENDGGTFTLTNSTITGNKAKVRGGGVNNAGSYSFTNNGTVSGNKAKTDLDISSNP